MTRIRSDNTFGTTTDNPLTAAATTMNSAGLANLAVVSSAEAIIILDPNRINGAPEHVVVTAHTGSATSATIVRGQFGTTARSHPLGTEWVHGPIASNASSFVTAADDQGDFVPMNAWESWTPTLTNLTLGNGTMVAAFTRSGRLIHYRFSFVLGSTSAVGTSPRFSLPVAAAVAYGTQHILGDLALLDSGTAGFRGHVKRSSGTEDGVMQFLDGNGNVANITATAPFTWTTLDQLVATGFYEALS